VSKLPRYIATRYLLAKKSHHVINIISWVSALGIAIAVAAMVIILSVFNGFQGMVADLFTAFDAPLKITPATGKYMASDEPELEALRKNPNVGVICETVEDAALFMVDNRQMVGTVKGVDKNFTDLVDIEQTLYGSGGYMLKMDVVDYGIFGLGVLETLGVGVDFPPIQVFAPRQGARISLANPVDAFTHEQLFSPGVGLSVKQGKYDNTMALTDISFARRLFERQGEVTAVELSPKEGVSVAALQKELKQQLGEKYVVKNRYEQQEDVFRIMKLEKFISYIFLTFIMLVACFNLIGSISMLMIDKREDTLILHNLGASERQLRGIFFTEGMLITLLGTVLGLLLGVALCWAQQEFGLVKFGRHAGNYIIDVYPVRLQWTDIVLVGITALAVGALAVVWPVRHYTKKFLQKGLQGMAMLAVALLIASCGSDNDKYVIRGEVDGMKGGEIYAYQLDDQTAKLDTIHLKDGQFQYTGRASSGTMPVFLVFGNAVEQVVFAAGGQTLKYKAKANDLKNYVVEGSDENEVMNNFRQEVNHLDEATTRQKARKYIEKDPKSLVSVYLFDRYFVQDESTPAEETETLLALLRKHQPDNHLLLSVAGSLKKLALAKEGSTIPALKLTTKQGGTVDLGALRKPYTLLVFWATWLPNQWEVLATLRALPKKDGAQARFDFVAVSLDTEIYEWEQAVRVDSASVRHICDGQAWNAPAVNQLGVRTLPTYFILDRSGKILHRGNKVEEMKKQTEKLIARDDPKD